MKNKNRAIASAAARGVYVYAAQAHLCSEADRLLAEARSVDDFSCTDAAMIEMASAELRKLRGQARGGHVSAAVRRSNRRLMPEE